MKGVAASRAPRPERSVWRPAIALLVLVSAAGAGALIGSLALEVAVLAAATSASAALLARLPVARAAAQRPRRAQPVPRLKRMERAAAAARHAGTLHTTLAPILRDIARHGLIAHGVDLDRDPAAARAALGAALFELVRPDPPPPADRRAPGLAPADLAAALTRLESLHS